MLRRSRSAEEEGAPDGAVRTQPEQGSALPPLASVVGLVLAAVVAVALFGLHDRDGSDQPASRGSRQRAPAAASILGSAVDAAVAPRATPPRTPISERLPGLPGARDRFSFTIRHPGYLPADIAPFDVDWQPDASEARRAVGLGELLTWFYSAEHGGILVLAQGPGVGIVTLGLRPDQRGRVWLADGTAAFWTVGHPVWDDTSDRPEPYWTGTELTLGVVRGNGEGWYLRSPIVRLEELIRIANSLR